MKLLEQSPTKRAEQIINILRQATKNMVEPASVSIVERYGRDPYLMLISCILSLRTKDTVSLPASFRLFEHATTPQAMLAVPLATIQNAIYPVGFYKTKARTILTLSQDILNRFGGQVPNTVQDLMSLKGVGLKTANLVLAEGFETPAICVDTHVHRISNRLGLVSTKTPEETETQLKALLPQKYWREYNRLLVMWGQNICVPISPRCSECPLFNVCPRVGVVKSR